MPEAERRLRASIVIVSYNARARIEACIDAVLTQGLPADTSEIIVVDNASADGTRELIGARYPQVQLLALPANAGFAEASNRGAALAAGEWVVFLNDDTEVAHDWLQQLLAAAESRPDVGAVHAAQCFDWQVPHSDQGGPYLVPDLCRWGFVCYRPVSRDDAPFPTLHLSGASVMVRRQWVAQAGGPFAANYFTYGEDRELGLRLNGEGYVVLAVPGATLYHHQQDPFRSTGRRKVALSVRNGWRAYLANMYMSEFLIYAPLVCFGSLLKPWQFPAPLHHRLLAGAGLFVLTVAYLPLVLLEHLREPGTSRRSLAARRQPWGWMLRRLLDAGC